MYDRKTGSYWSHIIGKGIKGEYLGTQLESLPVQHMKWSEWKKIYPDSKVLVKSRFTTRSSYESYNNSRDRLGIMGGVNFDRRLDGKDKVLGLIVDDIPVVFPHKYFLVTNHVNYSIGGVDLLVVFSKDASSATAFSRAVGETALTFETAESSDGHYVKDKETGTIWNGLSGEALAGKLKGSKLEKLVGTQVFWFGWRGFYPRTVIWNPNE